MILFAHARQAVRQAVKLRLRRFCVSAGQSSGMWWFRLAALTLALVVLAPIVSLLSNVFQTSNGTLDHLVQTILQDVVWNTIGLLVIVGTGTAIIGTVCAWLVTMHTFPGSRQLQWLLLLPLAMPGFIVGYAYTDMLSFAGPLQNGLRSTFGWSKSDYWFPDIHTLPGVATMMTLVLYPYVYYLARTAFLEQSVTSLDVARSLGHGAVSRFFRVAVPLARPAIAAGVALAMMEALADFGTVQYFGVHTLTTAVYRTWFGMGDPVAAGQLASAALIVVAVMVLAERSARSKCRHHRAGRKELPLVPTPLSGARAVGAIVCCALPVLLGFVVPVLILVRLQWLGGEAFLSPRFLTLLTNSVFLAATASVIVTLAALILAVVLRVGPSALEQGVIRSAAIGYAVPGTVIAVAVLPAFGSVDAAINIISSELLGVSFGLVLSGSVAALMIAYLVRFLAVALGSLEAGYGKLPITMDHAARSLGCTPVSVLSRIHLPLLRRAILTAAILVFADVLKELPATLIVRPFNFDTLAVRVYQLASDERLPQAATGSLVIVAAGLIPIVLLTRSIAAEQRRP